MADGQSGSSFFFFFLLIPSPLCPVVVTFSLLHNYQGIPLFCSLLIVQDLCLFGILYIAANGFVRWCKDKFATNTNLKADLCFIILVLFLLKQKNLAQPWWSLGICMLTSNTHVVYAHTDYLKWYKTETSVKRKRKRSDSVLWQKPLRPQKTPKSNVTTRKRHHKIWLHNDCGPT